MSVCIRSSAIWSAEYQLPITLLVLVILKVFKEETTIKDEQGRPFPLLRIVSETVLYIVRYLGKIFGDYMDKCLESKMSFVFLTPSGLTESGRNFFRVAIEEVGVFPNFLYPSFEKVGVYWLTSVRLSILTFVLLSFRPTRFDKIF